MVKHARDGLGRDMATMEESEVYGLGMTIVNDATYRFHGTDYLATLEEDASDTMASFQSLPIYQIDDEPSLFLDRNDGSLCDDTGTVVGEYHELELIH